MSCVNLLIPPSGDWICTVIVHLTFAHDHNVFGASLSKYICADTGLEQRGCHFRARTVFSVTVSKEFLLKVVFVFLATSSFLHCTMSDN